MSDDKIYDVPADWAKRAWANDAKYKEMYAASIADPDKFWGEQAKRIDLDQALHQGEEHLLRAGQHLDQMVRGRHAQRLLQLRRPSSRKARQPDRDHLGRRRSQGRQEDHLQGAARRGAEVRQRPQEAGRQERRPRHHLPADGARGGLRHPRLRADRRHPLGDLRRLLAGLDRRPRRRLQIGHHRHRRRRHSRRSQNPAQGQCRRRLRESAGALRHRRQAHRRSGQHEGRPRRLLRRCREGRAGGLPLRGDEGGRSAVHPLHIRLDRQAERRAAHHRRLRRIHLDHAPICVRLPRRRHLLVHRRRRLGHRPQLHSLWTALERRDHADVRRRAELSEHVALLGSDRQAQGQHVLHRANRDPRADAGRRRSGEEDLARFAAPARFGRRADQPGGVGMVLPRGRR